MGGGGGEEEVRTVLGVKEVAEVLDHHCFFLISVLGMIRLTVYCLCKIGS